MGISILCGLLQKRPKFAKDVVCKCRFSEAHGRASGCPCKRRFPRPRTRMKELPASGDFNLCEKFMPQEVVKNNITKTRHLLLSLQDVLPIVFAGHICSQDIGNSIARQDVVKLTMQRVPDAQLRLREPSAPRSETASGGMLAWLHLQWLHSQAWLCIHIATARKQHGAVVPGPSTKPYVRLILPPTTATRL